eukprot:TRINITY_DN85_c0_g1_i1.p1 TRINITY_DN85_c0_g1~~TRINITY_DN85_c0_g1_i1.p1  ORF type:complete len:365 (-),score=72.88 TRINITY_DN85_c0_g1_i1:142-1236(-)
MSASKQQLQREQLGQCDKQETFTSQGVVSLGAPSQIQKLSEEENVVGYVVPAKAKNLSQLLENTTVDDVLAHRGHLVTLNDTDSVNEALRTLRDSGVSSAPVYDVGHKFMGMVDMKDFLEYLFPLLEKRGDDVDFDEDFLKQPVGNVVESSRSNPTVMVDHGTTLLSVLNTLSQDRNYRVGVLERKDHTVFNIVSQLSLIKFFAKNISIFPEILLSFRVVDFMEQMVESFSIPSDTTTLKTLKYLHREQISGAPVVDCISGQIIDTFSCTDLQGFVFGGPKFSFLEKSVVEFLSSARRTKSIKPPITCNPNDTLESVLLKLAGTGVHRLWVISEDLEYRGLVNLTHLLDFIRRHLCVDKENDLD